MPVNRLIPKKIPKVGKKVNPNKLSFADKQKYVQVNGQLVLMNSYKQKYIKVGDKLVLIKDYLAQTKDQK